MGIAHVVLHVSLCGAIARAKPATTIAMRVRIVDRRSTTRFERAFTVERGDDDNPKVVEFDAPEGTYRLDATAPKYGCDASQFVTLLPDLSRTVDVALAAGAPDPGGPLLVDGTSPQSFSYVAPAFVLFDKGATPCNAPVGQTIPFRVAVENDQDAYYASLFGDPSLTARGPLQLALRLRTPTHQYHYVRVPIPFPMPWGGWPSNVRFDVTQDMIDALASQPVDTLLCLRMWETKVYF